MNQPFIQSVLLSYLPRNLGRFLLPSKSWTRHICGWRWLDVHPSLFPSHPVKCPDFLPKQQSRPVSCFGTLGAINMTIWPVKTPCIPQRVSHRESKRRLAVTDDRLPEKLPDIFVQIRRFLCGLTSLRVRLAQYL